MAAQPLQSTPKGGGYQAQQSTKSSRLVRPAIVLGLISAFASVPAASAHSFPYVQTQILAPDTCFSQSACHQPDLAYIFSQGDDDSVKLLSLNVSGTIRASSNLDTVTSGLPFLDGSKDRAFGAARTNDGAIYVYAGECEKGPGTIWVYGMGAGGGANGEDAWMQKKTSASSGGGRGGSPSRGPYFLGGTIAFSGQLAPTMDQPTMFAYGGMCATPNDNSTDWQSSANYTKSMMSLAPSNSSENADSYVLDLASTAGPSSAIAGFSLTELQSSMSNLSGTVTQQSSYVILGGHTQKAFINMSTAAVWNLPEESWSYINVAQAPAGQSKKRAAADAPEVDSRSGHTAVLSEDGKSVVVLGGWVGDITNAADPQLLVLDVGESYSSWQWNIPKAQPTGNGRYGHGAALLPGNVMMVYGGWQIESSNSSKVKRQTDTTSALQFLNLTSMSWTTSYSNPNADKSSSGTAPNSTTTTSKSNHLGLGLGLGIGLAALCLLVVLFVVFCWRRKQRHRKEAREEAIRSIAQDASAFVHDGDEMSQVPWTAGSWYGQDPYRTGGYESVSQGSYGGYAPVLPGSIQRKPVARQLRGGYVPANAQISNLISPPGQIHPIMEADEEDVGHQRINPNDITTPTSEVPSDPFLTPTVATGSVLPGAPRSSATPSPDGHREGHRDPDVQDWVEDVDAADALLTRYNNRQGPGRRNSHRSTHLRDDESRTGSNLSESNRSAIDSVTRTLSGRWANLAAGAGGIFGAAALQASTEPAKPGSSSSSSYNTAKSGFGALQAEGPGLLPGRTSPSPFDDDEIAREPSSPSKHRPRRSWFGSLKRVFSTSEEASGASSYRSENHGDSADMLSSDYEPLLSGLGGELLKRKQGRQDWEGSETIAGPSGAAGEGEWDIERAIEQRLVQIMFTVPRERLRVVNGAEDEEDDEVSPLHQPQTAEFVDPDKASTQGSMSSRGRRAATSRISQNQDDEEGGGAPVGVGEPEESYLRVDPSFDMPRPSFDARRLSHASTAGSLRSNAVFMAEAMTFERPKTRVLQMVDSIESRSRSNSPRRSEAGNAARSMKSAKSLLSIRNDVDEEEDELEEEEKE